MICYGQMLFREKQTYKKILPVQGRRLGVDKDEKLLLTLSRGTEADPWGFSLVGARDILEQVRTKN